MRQHDEEEDRGIEPADGFLSAPGISLIAPRDWLSAEKMPLDSFRLADIAGVPERALVDDPA
jgi:hypothetical protein